MSSKVSHWPFTVLSILSGLINAALPLVLVRVLDVADVGSFKQFSLLLMVASGPLLLSGLLNSVTYFAAKSTANSSELGLVWLIIAVISAISGLAFFCNTEAIGSIFSLNTGFVPLLGICVSSLSLGKFYEECLVARGRIWFAALFSSGFEIIRCMLTIWVALNWRSLEILLILTAALLLFKAVLTSILCFSEHLISFTFTKAEVSTVIKYTLPLALAAALSLPYQYVDQLIVSKFMPVEQFALYALGCLSIAPLYQYEVSIGKVLMGDFSRLHHQGVINNAMAAFRKGVSDLAFVLIPCSLGIMVFASPIVTLLFTEKYQSADVYLSIFALSYMLLCLPASIVPRSLGDGNWILKNSAIFLLLALITTFIVLIILNAQAVLVSALICNLIQRCTGMMRSMQLVQCKIADLLPISYLFKSLGVAGVLSILASIAQPIFSNPIVWLAVCGPTAAILYLVVMKTKLFRRTTT